jgi:tetratricopeptide (TPR) repeat protein
MALARKIGVQGYPLRGKGGVAMVTVTALCRSLLAVLVMATLAVAADVPRSSRTPEDQDLSEARARIDAKDWPGAAEILKKAVARDPGNAEYHNLFAYSVRHTANPDMNVVFEHYREALRIAPQHRGAHEYIGEAYLMVGDLPRAKEHLAALDKLCFFSCAEYRDLKKAIERYEKKQ